MEKIQPVVGATKDHSLPIAGGLPVVGVFTNHQKHQKIAIIGTGIAGMGCGHFLHQSYDLEFYEQNNYIGGHTNTVLVNENGKDIPIDTGFIVFNEETYPNLLRLFRELKVEIKPTNMSFGVQYLPTGLEYSSLHLFARFKDYFNPRHWQMLLQIKRFFVEAEALLTDEKYALYTIEAFVKERKYSQDFLYKYIVPMSSALWSTPTEITLQFPARVLAQFFKNHGLLGIGTQFQWYTVHRGSAQYRDKLIAPFRNRINVGVAVTRVVRESHGVTITGSDGVSKQFDKVIFACHADQALRLLADPTALEEKLLKPFHYQKNIATLHTDESIMPKTRSTWSAWNYRVIERDGQLKATTIYDMNILQQVSQVKNYFVSINDPGEVDPSKVLRKIEYEHPVFTPATARAQQELSQLNENETTFFCGSYFRFGFHEDAFTSSVNLCQKLLGADPWTLSKAKNPKATVLT